MLFSIYCFGQKVNPISTAVPFLQIEPNANTNGIGLIGVVSSKDHYESGLTQNPALLSKNKKTMGATISYLPWFDFAKKPNISNFGAWYAFNSKNTLAMSINYYNNGNIELHDLNGNIISEYRPIELCTGLKYAHSFNEHLSLGLGVKYIYSDINGEVQIGNSKMVSGKSIAGDIGLDYRNEINISETKNLRYDFGASILNVGNKISYTTTDNYKDFIPTILKLGTMWTINSHISKNITHSTDLAYQAEKLLVPTPPVWTTDTTRLGKSTDVSVFKGMVQSFYDAPNGYKEELQEIIHMFGIENRFTVYDKATISLRVGKMHENKYKGNRNITTLGVGLKFKSFCIDYCYLKYKEPQDFNKSNITVGYCYVFK